MKKNILVLALVLFLLLFCSACNSEERIITTEISQTESYIDNLYSDAMLYFGDTYGSVDNPFEPKNGKYNFRVLDFSDTNVTINDNGEIQNIPVIRNKSNGNKYVPKSIEEYNPEAYENVKERLIDFISKTDFFVGKEHLIEEINALPMYKADFTDDNMVAAYYDDDDKCVYVSKSVDKQFFEKYFERIVLHEMVHALQSLTMGGAGNVEYLYSIFDEVLAEMITSSMNPHAGEEILSEYDLYFLQGYSLIAIFGEEIIEGYFYGYSSIKEKIPEDEFEFFIFTFGNSVYDPVAANYMNTLIYKWEYRYVIL